MMQKENGALSIETGGRTVGFAVESLDPVSEQVSERSDSVTSSTSPRNVTDRRALLKRASTIGRLSFSSRSSAKEIIARNSLSYDTHSWIDSFKIVFKTFYGDTFLLRPWIVLSVWSILVAILGEAFGLEARLALPTDVSIGIVGSMALLLTLCAVRERSNRTRVLRAVGPAALCSHVLRAAVGSRLNVCYNRWWEGRQLWGVLITAARGIVTRLLAEGEHYYVDPENRSPSSDSEPQATPRMAAGYCCAFAFCLRKHVLGEKLEPDHVEPGLHRLIGRAQLLNVANAQHPPLHCLHCLRATLTQLVRVARRRQVSEDGGGGAIALEISLAGPTQEMHSMLAGCERLVGTPCPAGYVGVLRMVLLFFLFILPNVLLDELGWWMIPTASVTSFAILAVEEVAMHIEQPFGTDDDDLPLEAYCLNLLADMLALLDEEVPLAGHRYSPVRRSPPRVTSAEASAAKSFAS